MSSSSSSACSDWERHWPSLEQFWKEHGHCNVPVDYQKDPELATWVRWFRSADRRSALTSQQQLMLMAAGLEELVLAPRGSSRDSSLLLIREEHTNNYDDLFCQQEGHNHQNNGNSNSNSKISDSFHSEEQEQQQQPRSWYDNYLHLAKFKEAHGHCLVPFDDKDREFVHWVRTLERVPRPWLERRQEVMLQNIGFYEQDAKVSNASGAAEESGGGGTNEGLLVPCHKHRGTVDCKIRDNGVSVSTNEKEKDENSNLTKQKLWEVEHERDALRYELQELKQQWKDAAAQNHLRQEHTREVEHERDALRYELQQVKKQQPMSRENLVQLQIDYHKSQKDRQIMASLLAQLKSERDASVKSQRQAEHRQSEAKRAEQLQIKYNQELHDTLRQAEEKRDFYCQESDRYRKELLSTSDRLRVLQVTQETQLEGFREMERARDSIGQELENTWEEVQDLRKQLYRMAEERNKMKETSREVGNERDDLRSQNKELHKELSTAHSSIDQLEEALNEVQAISKEEGDGQKRQLLKQLEDSKKERDALRLELQDREHQYSSHIASSRKELVDTSKQLNTHHLMLEQERDALRYELQEMRQENKMDRENASQERDLLEKQVISVLREIEEKGQLQLYLGQELEETQEATVAALDGYRELLGASDRLEQGLREISSIQRDLEKELREAHRRAEANVDRRVVAAEKAHRDQSLANNHLRQQLKSSEKMQVSLLERLEKARQCARTLTKEQSDTILLLKRKLQRVEEERYNISKELCQAKQQYSDTQKMHQGQVETNQLLQQQLQATARSKASLCSELQKADERALDAAHNSKILYEANREVRAERDIFRKSAADHEAALQDKTEASNLLKEHIQELEYQQSALRYELEVSKHAPSSSPPPSQMQDQMVPHEASSGQLHRAQFERDFFRNTFRLVERRALKAEAALHGHLQRIDQLKEYIVEEGLVQDGLRYELQTTRHLALDAKSANRSQIAEDQLRLDQLKPSHDELPEARAKIRRLEQHADVTAARRQADTLCSSSDDSSSDEEDEGLYRCIRKRQTWQSRGHLCRDEQQGREPRRASATCQREALPSSPEDPSRDNLKGSNQQRVRRPQHCDLSNAGRDARDSTTAAKEGISELFHLGNDGVRYGLPSHGRNRTSIANPDAEQESQVDDI